MLEISARRAAALTAFTLAWALVLMAAWHGAGSAPRGLDDGASPAGTEHRTGCPLRAPRLEAASAPARKAASALPALTGDCPPLDRVPLVAARRPNLAARAGPVPSRALYLVNLRLLR